MTTNPHPHAIDPETARPLLPCEKRLLVAVASAVAAIEEVRRVHDGDAEFTCPCRWCEQITGGLWALESLQSQMDGLLPCHPDEVSEAEDPERDEAMAIRKGALGLARLFRRNAAGHAAECACKDCKSAGDMETLAADMQAMLQDSAVEARQPA